MVAFPAAAAAISLACALVVAWDGLRRPKPDKAAWAVAFALFAVAAGAEVVGEVAGWTPLLVRGYYLAGAVLVVGFLALGEFYLLAPRRTAILGPGAALLVTALAVAVVQAAPIDEARLASDGWEALERGPALKGLAIGLNAGGTVVLVGGALLSAGRFWRRGVHRHRMFGCVLIALGTLVVASGGTLTRLGRAEYLYVAMAAGVAIIFAGYLEARRPDVAPADRAASGDAAEAEMADASTPAPRTGATAGRGALVPLPSVRGARPRESGAAGDPAIAFVEAHLLGRDQQAAADAARVWSAEPKDADRFGREEARRAWALRLRLSPAGRTAFDALPVPVRLQWAELYHEVLAPGATELDAERRAIGGG